ncbi:hypothetical protein Pyrfu_1088 [Pyrolobus fumarii 1A]|uniref:Uncharacterized protein n=1 Tax=Pyrolobus fumarii (strain DSM 11204 / 1A) TaxID=694429 RepID=G0EF59_PYRF1|nr:hypothetical protein [Pyrolobus fumarii]AEM38956.1 hypothetical protein Pyrfu_1088 [Pyrolobus fumarii 1A]
MIDPKGLLIVSTAIALVSVVIGMAFASSSIEVVKACIVERGAHHSILLELNVGGLHSLRGVWVNGERIEMTSPIVITSGRVVLLIESMSSVRVFPSIDAAMRYIMSPDYSLFPGRPLPDAIVYHVRLVFDSGLVIDYVIKKGDQVGDRVVVCRSS